jgi:Zn-finger nucleic acid-binding protein
MLCPKCRKATLAEMHVGDVRTVVDQCRSCGGIWFDRKELEAIMDLAARDLRIPASAEVTKRCCPRDFEKLLTFRYPQTEVMVDMCRRCDGLWLDGGELTEIRKIRDQLDEHGELNRSAPAAGIVGGLERLLDWVVEEIGDIEIR